MTSRNFSIALLVANVLGAGAFLAIASSAWIEPELAEVPGASAGGPIVWVLAALPIALIFVLSDLGVLIWAALRRHRLGRWPVSKLLWLCVPLWTLALIFDNLQHGI